MKRLAIVALLTLAAPLAAVAQEQTSIRIGDGSGGDVDGDLVPRMRLGEARSAIVSRSGDIALLLTGDALLMQFTDEGRERIDREIDEDLEEEGLFARMIGGVVRSSLDLVFDRAMAFDLDDIRSVRYADGRLEVTSRDGEPLFEDSEIDGRPLLENFHERDARAFAATFARLKKARRI